MFCTPRAKVAPEGDFDELQQRYRALQGDFNDLQQKYRALHFRHENLWDANEALQARLTRSERTSTALEVKVRHQMNTIEIEVLKCSRTKDELKQAKANIEVLTQRVQHVKDEMTLERERAAELLHATIESLNDANARAMAGANAEIRALKVYKSKFTFLRAIKKTKFPFIDLLHCSVCFESKNHSMFSVTSCGHVNCTQCMVDWRSLGHTNCLLCNAECDHGRLFINVEEQDD
jgi:DNA repair exonuclease SbcCD ATPase subunit